MRIFSPGFAQRRAPGRWRTASKRSGSMKFGITSIGVSSTQSCSIVFFLSHSRDRGDRVRGDHRPARGLEVGGVVADQGDVGAVERGHHRQRPRRDDLARQDRRDRVGHGVVDVQQVEPLEAGDLGHLRGERERVGRVLEERVVRDHHLVEEEVGRDESEARRQRVGEDVDLVAGRGERHRELGRDHARAAEGRVAADADAHASSNADRRGRSCQGSATASMPRLPNGSPSSAPIRLP